MRTSYRKKIVTKTIVKGTENTETKILLTWKANDVRYLFAG